MIKLSDEIIKVLDSIAQKFGIAIDWTGTNVVPYLKEVMNRLVTYEFATSVIWLILSILFITVTTICTVKLIKHGYNHNEQAEYSNEIITWPFWLSIIPMAIGTLFFICLMCQVVDIIACQTFPEKIVIEYIQSYMTTHQLLN